MILAQMQNGRNLAFSPNSVTRIVENEVYSSKLSSSPLCGIFIEGSDREYGLNHTFNSVIKAIDEHNKTGKSVSLVEGITL